MPHLLQQFRANGGTVMARKLESLDEIASDFDVIVNCTGLGAKHLVNDPSVHPIRGHIFRVINLGILVVSKTTIARIVFIAR